MLIVLAAVLMVVLRCIRLDSDAYAHLSWSSALLTDEGFYIHNARNVVLFGTPRTDGFNNMLIMPTLHYVQVWVFRTFGTGAVQARSISVACGLLETAALAVCMSRLFGRRVGMYSALFIGLSHTSLLYSRMALMDTPAALFLTLVFCLWCEAAVRCSAGKSPAVASAAAGLITAICYVTRGLTVWSALIPWLLLPLCLQALPARKKQWWSAALWQLGGLGAGLAVYLVLWYLPNRHEIAAMNHYYLAHQLMPHSLLALKGNLSHAVVGDYRGLFPYLFRHSPVTFVLTIAATGALLVARKRGSAGIAEAVSPANPDEGAVARNLSLSFLGWWLLLPSLAYSIISYAPDRYYVLFYPAMAALAAVAVERIDRIADTIRGTLAQTAVAGLVTYHLAEALLHHRADWLLATSVVVAVGIFWPVQSLAKVQHGLRFITAPALLIALWVATEVAWTSDWLMHPAYTQRDACTKLQKLLPADAVLVGDIGPGLSLDSKFRAVSVIPGLCNDEFPLGIAAGHPAYIAILDGRFLEPFWREYCPKQIVQQHRVAFFPAMLGKYPVGIYRVSIDPLADANIPAADRQ